jgi:hypothetical protein
MKTCSLYDPATGIFNGMTISASDEELLKKNIPDGCGAIDGVIDHLAYSVDIETGTVVDYQPPQPNDDHEWITDTKRWQIKPDIIKKQQDKAQALAQLQLLDAKHLRALDEVIAEPDNMVARDNLDAIRKLKIQLRKKLV